MRVSRNSMTAVVAMARNRVIGKGNDIPWAGKLRTDMEHFKNYTMGKIAVVGRKTYDSIPPKYKPLVGRENWIMTRDPELRLPGCTMVYDSKAVEVMSLGREICIIGGAEIYKIFLPKVTRIIMTHIDADVPGDTFFPEVLGDWELRQIMQQEVDERNIYPFSITEYTRVEP